MNNTEESTLGGRMRTLSLLAVKEEQSELTIILMMKQNSAKKMNNKIMEKLLI